MERDLAELATELGGNVVEHRQLAPRTRSEARAHTLSGRHGTGAFPWHTDAAHHPRPPRLLVMRAVHETGLPTLLADAFELLDTQLERLLRAGSWVVRGRGAPFFAPAIARDGSLRFNSDVMTPASDRAVHATRVLYTRLSKLATAEHEWHSGEALLLDNARMLHARPAVPDSERTRLLARILFDLSGRLGR